MRLSNSSLLLGNQKLAGTESRLFNSRINKTLLIMPRWLQHVTLSSPYHSSAAHTTHCNFNGVTLTKVIITHYSAAFLRQKRTKRTITQLINRRMPYYCTSAHAHIKPLITVANRLQRFDKYAIPTVAIVSTTSWREPPSAQGFSQQRLSERCWGILHLQSQSLTRKASLESSLTGFIIITLVSNI